MGKLTNAIVSLGLLYGTKVLAQEALEDAGDLPEGWHEFGVLDDSETWGKLLNVERREDGLYLKLNERLPVKTNRGYNRNFGLEDVMVFFQDMDSVEKRKDPEKKDFRYVRSPASEFKLPDWISDGPFRVYLLSGRGQISTRKPENVYRLDEHYELPQPAGVLQLGGGESISTAQKSAGVKPDVTVKPAEQPNAASVVKPSGPSDAIKSAAITIAASVVRRPAVRGGETSRSTVKPRGAATRLFSKLRGDFKLEGSFANTDVASPNTDITMSGGAGGVGFTLGYPVRAWNLGLFGDFNRRGFDTENTYGVSLGRGNHSTDFAAGATCGFASQSGRRIDLLARMYFGFLGHRGRNSFEKLSFEENGNGLVLGSNIALPRLFKKTGKFYWGLKDEFSLESLSLRQRENNFDFESRYGWKTRGTNELSTTFAFRRADVKFGWQLDSVYSLEPVSNKPFNVSENSTHVDTENNLYGNQAVFGATYGRDKYVGLNATLPLAGDVNRKGIELRFGNFNNDIGLSYEDVKADGIRDRRFVVSLTMRRGYLLPRQRRVYPGIR